jgi:lysophospholipase L1-like esterase
MTRLATALCLLALPCCDGVAHPQPAATPPATGAVTIRPSDPAIRTVGRFDRSDAAALRFAWPATAFRLRFTGTSVALVLRDTPLPDDTPETDCLAVTVDGRPLAPLELAKGTRTYEIARGLAPGAHEIAAAKRTEPEVGTVALLGVALDPGARALPPGRAATRRMEIVGDSICAGAGIEGRDPSCPLDAATEDATRTFGALAARSFGADVQIIAWKGKGVLRNDNPADAETLPAIYDRTLPGDPASGEAQGFGPDVVVLNLGTNDFARSAPPGRDFEAAYDGFVGVLRRRSPGALIVLAVGPLLFDEPGRMWRQDVKKAIESTIARRAATGDTRLALMDAWTERSDGDGCQMHPNLATHRKMAALLVRIVEDRLGWKAAALP